MDRKQRLGSNPFGLLLFLVKLGNLELVTVVVDAGPINIVDDAGVQSAKGIGNGLRCTCLARGSEVHDCQAASYVAIHNC